MLEAWLTEKGSALLFTGLSLFGMMIFRETLNNFASSVWFRFNPIFKEGDVVLVDGEKVVINKIGFKQTIFSYVSKKMDGKRIWRVVPNERIKFLKLELIVHEQHDK